MVLEGNLGPFCRGPFFMITPLGWEVARLLSFCCPRVPCKAREPACSSVQAKDQVRRVASCWPLWLMSCRFLSGTA